jgi:DNA-binding MarR family transcriptional regulator
VTTALRWIDYLDEKGLVLRERSNLDRRASAIRLSNDGRARLDRYFLDMIARVDESGLVPVGA